MSISTFNRVLPAAIAAATMTSIALADTFDSHVGINVENNHLSTQGWQSGTGYLGEKRLFAFDIESGPGIADVGTNSVGGTFTTPGEIGFSFMGQLHQWNGDDFTASINHMIVQRGPLQAQSSTGVVVGFGTAVRDENSHPSDPAQWGRHHVHADYWIGGDNVQDGIYLIEMQLWYQGAGSYADSKSFWMLLNRNADLGDVQLAIDFANANIVPAPGALALLGLAGLAGVSRRRRR